MVNSGRLSKPCVYPLTAPDDPALPAASRPGAVAPDAPLADGWLSESLGRAFCLLTLGQAAPQGTGLRILSPDLTEPLRQRYFSQARSAIYLIRPYQVVAVRWLNPTAADITTARDAAWDGL